MKVLIVDDNPKIMAIAKAHLKKEYHEVFCVDDGKSALESARQEKPDLILLDVDMPGMSGFEVCKILKDSDELCMIPVVFLTAADDNTSRIRGLGSGGSRLCHKTF